MLNASKREDNLKIGSRLRKYRKRLGFNSSDFAKNLNRNRSYISGVENGHYPLSPKLISLIERTFGLNARWILSDVEFSDKVSSEECTLKCNNNIREVPVIGETEAGLPSAIIDDKLGSFFSTENTIAVKNFAGEDIFALKVKGYSMSPRVLPGDIVIVSATRNPKLGQMCVAVTVNNESTLKIYEESNENLILKPINPHNNVIILKKDEVLKIYAVLSILATSDYV